MTGTGEGVQRLATVIMPVHNAEKTLERQLRALSQQTWKTIEVLLVDDGSTDKSPALCRRAAQQDPRFRAVCLPGRGGVAKARNLALDQAKGDYILFADADDLVCPRYVERLIQVLQDAQAKDPGIHMATCLALDVTEDGRQEYTCDDHATPRLYTVEDYSFFDHASHRVVWGAGYERAAIGDMRFDTRFFCSTDTLFFAQLFKKERRYVHVDERLYCYMLQDASITVGRYTRRRMDNILVWEEVRDLYRDEPERIRRSAAAYPVLCAIRDSERLVQEGSPDKALMRDVQSHYRHRFSALWHSHQRRSLSMNLAVCAPSLFIPLYRLMAGRGKDRLAEQPQQAPQRGEPEPADGYDWMTREGIRLLQGVLQHTRGGTSLPDLPRVETACTYPHPGAKRLQREKAERAERFEILVRTFLLAAPLLHEQPELTVDGIPVAEYYKAQLLLVCGEEAPLRERAGRYEELLRLGGNPNATFQQTAEVGTLVIALWMSREALWDRLTPGERDCLAAFISGYAHGNTCPQNWRLFNMLALAFLHANGYAADEGRMRALAQGILADDAGDGWYRDGEHFDYYNAWTYHTFLPLWCLWYGDEMEPELAAAFRERSLRFHAHFHELFAEDGRMILWGRSALYRCAVGGAFYGLGLLAPEETDSLPSWGRVRRVLLGVTRQFTRRADCFAGGVLTPGFYGPFEPALQPYSCRGSAYWAAMAFWPLSLGRAHPLWSAQEDCPPPEAARSVCLPGPGLCVDRAENGAFVTLRSGRVRLNPEDRKGAWAYARLCYHTDFPWDASAQTQQYVLSRGGRETWPNLILWAGQAQDVLYRQAFFRFSDWQERQWMDSLLLADCVLPGGGLLRMDRLVPMGGGFRLRLGSYALGGTAPERVQVEEQTAGDARALILTAEAEDGVRRMAMTVWAPWGAPELIWTDGTNPCGGKACHIRAEWNVGAVGPDAPVLLSQVITRIGGEPFTSQELFPVRAVQRTLAGAAVRLEDGRTLEVVYMHCKGGQL